MPGILGIDPGVSGAAALYDRTLPSASCPRRWLFVDIIDLPVIGDEKRELNPTAFRDWLSIYSPEHAYLELVTAMPSIPGADGVRRGMGAAGAFRFGGFFYAIKAVLACCDVPFTLVTPQKWKAAHGLKGSDKEASRARALQLFPDTAASFARKKDQNRAEAALIASYGVALNS
jgi:hypothetical protein